MVQKSFTMIKELPVMKSLCGTVCIIMFLQSTFNKKTLPFYNTVNPMNLYRNSMCYLRA